MKIRAELSKRGKKREKSMVTKAGSLKTKLINLQSDQLGEKRREDDYQYQQ